MMRVFLLTTLLALAVNTHAADPPHKRGGGLFGFRAPKGEQISADLFPNDGSRETQATQKTDSDESTIFKTGQPQQVDPVSYVIEKGKKVAKPIGEFLQPSVQPVTEKEKKKGGIFSFGKRGDKDRNNENRNNEIVTPIAVPETETGKPTSIVNTPAPMPNASPVGSGADAPAFEGVKTEKKKSGWIPFLSRKKSDDAPAMESPGNTDPVIPPVASDANSGPVKPVALAAKPPFSDPAKPETATFEVPRDTTKKAESKKEEKSDREGGLLSPIAHIRPLRKELDLTSAETIIQDGKIVGDSGTTFETNPTSASTSPRQAPQVVNGIKTYSSWNDVTASSSSAADKIIQQIR